MPFPILGVDSDNGTRVHQSSPARLVRETPDHLHPVAAGQQQRRLPRRAEELGDRAHRGRLPPLRHRGRTVAAQQDLGAAVAADELLLPAAETHLQGPRPARKCPRSTTRATTPHRRAERHEKRHRQDKAILADTYTSINPAAVQRQIQALTSELLTLTTSKAAPKPKRPSRHSRAHLRMSQRISLRAHLDLRQLGLGHREALLITA